MDDVVDTVRLEIAAPPLERVTLVALNVAVRPAGADESVKPTVPVNPLRLVRVAVEVADDPCTMLRLLGLAVREKSGRGAPLTITETLAVWNSVPLIPAIEAAYVPGGVDAGAEIVMVAVEVSPAAKRTMPGLTSTTRFPVTTVVFRLVVPEKPLMLVTLRVDVTDRPAVTVTVLGLVAKTKSGVVVVAKMAV